MDGESQHHSETGSYIRKNERGYGSTCLPSWLETDRHPRSLAIRAI